MAEGDREVVFVAKGVIDPSLPTSMRQIGTTATEVQERITQSSEVTATKIKTIVESTDAMVEKSLKMQAQAHREEGKVIERYYHEEDMRAKDLNRKATAAYDLELKKRSDLLRRNIQQRVREEEKAQYQLEVAMRTANSRIQHANDAALAGSRVVLRGFAAISFGLGELGVLTEGNADKLIRKMLAIHAAYNLIRGTISVLQGVTRTWRNYTLAVEAAAVAHAKLAAVQTVTIGGGAGTVVTGAAVGAAGRVGAGAVAGAGAGAAGAAIAKPSIFGAAIPVLVAGTAAATGVGLAGYSAYHFVRGGNWDQNSMYYKMGASNLNPFGWLADVGTGAAGWAADAAVGRLPKGPLSEKYRALKSGWKIGEAQEKALAQIEIRRQQEQDWDAQIRAKTTMEGHRLSILSLPQMEAELLRRPSSKADRETEDRDRETRRRAELQGSKLQDLMAGVYKAPIERDTIGMPRVQPVTPKMEERAVSDELAEKLHRMMDHIASLDTVAKGSLKVQRDASELSNRIGEFIRGAQKPEDRPVELARIMSSAQAAMGAIDTSAQKVSDTRFERISTGLAAMEKKGEWTPKGTDYQKREADAMNLLKAERTVELLQQEQRIREQTDQKSIAHARQFLGELERQYDQTVKNVTTLQAGLRTALVQLIEMGPAEQQRVKKAVEDIRAGTASRGQFKLGIQFMSPDEARKAMDQFVKDHLMPDVADVVTKGWKQEIGAQQKAADVFRGAIDAQNKVIDEIAKAAEESNRRFADEIAKLIKHIDEIRTREFKRALDKVSDEIKTRNFQAAVGHK